MSNKDDVVEGKGPAGGWGSLKGIASISIESSASPSAVDTLRRMNKPGGLMCPSCAWPKPKNYSAFEFCENGHVGINERSLLARILGNTYGARAPHMDRS